MTQEPKKSNVVLIVIAIIGVIGTITASAIGANSNSRIERERQEFELTRIALVSIATQGGETQMVLENTINAPMPSSEPTDTLVLTPLPTTTVKPSATATETATAFVPPVDGILFHDGFDNGMRSEWVVYSGDWIISNGKLTVLENKENEYNWLALSDFHWNNFVVSFDIEILSNRNYDSFAVSVRKKGAELIGVIQLPNQQTFLAFIPNKWTDRQSIVGEIEERIPRSSKIEIEVRNNSYTLRVNGREHQNVTISGYDSSDIRIGVYCNDASDGCPTFDNVNIVYLP